MSGFDLKHRNQPVKCSTEGTLYNDNFTVPSSAS